MEIEHKVRHAVSTLAKSLVALKVPRPARRPLSSVKAPLAASSVDLVKILQK